MVMENSYIGIFKYFFVELKGQSAVHLNTKKTHIKMNNHSKVAIIAAISIFCYGFKFVKVGYFR